MSITSGKNSGNRGYKTKTVSASISGGGLAGTPGSPLIGWGTGYSYIFWPEAPAGSAGPTLGYGAMSSPSCDFSVSGLRLNINRVLADTVYSFVVWGVNAAGKGRNSNLLQYLWASPPVPVVSGTPGSASVTLDWQDVTGASGYIIRYRQVYPPSNPWITIDNVVPSTYTVAPLLDATYPWEFQVASIVGVVQSNWSTPLVTTPGPPIPDGPTVTHNADSVGVWTISNYNASYIYTLQSSTGNDVTRNGATITSTSSQTIITLTVQLVSGGPSASIQLQSQPYVWNYNPSVYVCTNQTFDNCGPPLHPDGSYYCYCGTLGSCGNPNDCCGWVCHAGYNTDASYNVTATPSTEGWTSSSNISGTVPSVPTTPPGEWYKVISS